MEPKIVLMDRDYSPDVLDEKGALDLRNIRQAAWEQIILRCKSVSLRLYHLIFPSLDGSERLESTASLSMEWANKIPDLGPVFKMSWLRSLFVSDFPRLSNIAGIEALQDLRTLHLSGNRGSLQPPLRLSSLQPIAELSNLEELAVLNVRLQDDDITFLASLPKLRELTLSNSFDRKQFAFLASKLNAQLNSPISASREMNLPCTKCGKPLSCFIGKRQPSVCKNCDRTRFERLTTEFQEIMAAS
jgi:hypothetical protein